MGEGDGGLMCVDPFMYTNPDAQHARHTHPDTGGRRRARATGATRRWTSCCGSGTPSTPPSAPWGTSSGPSFLALCVYACVCVSALIVCKPSSVFWRVAPRSQITYIIIRTRARTRTHQTAKRWRRRTGCGRSGTRCRAPTARSRDCRVRDIMWSVD